MSKFNGATAHNQGGRQVQPPRQPKTKTTTQPTTHAMTVEQAMKGKRGGVK